MAITSINNIHYAYLSQKSGKKNPSVISTCQKPIGPQKEIIPFKGFGFFRLVKRAPELPPTTEREVIEALAKVESGLYLLKNNVFNHMTIANYQASKPDGFSTIIFKQPKQDNHRPGISPRMVMSFLEKSCLKVIMVVDDGLQILSLPANQEERLNALTLLSQKRKIKAEKTNVQTFNTPKTTSDFFFELAQTMIKNAKIEGIKLEKTSSLNLS